MHFHLPKPLHGWRELIGEVGIIVVGVLIALSAEQLVEGWNTHRRVEEDRDRVRAELGHAFEVAEERTVVRQCIDEQLTKTENAILGSGSVLEPLPLYRASQPPNEGWVVWTPSRILPDSAWQTLIAEGLSSHLPSEERTWLPVVYSSLTRAGSLNFEESLQGATSPHCRDRSLWTPK